MLCSVHVTREANGKVRGLCLLFAPVLRQLSFALPTSAASFGPQGALDLLQRTGQFQLQPNVVSYSGSAKTVPCCLLSCLMFSIFFHTASCGKKVQNSPSRELKSEAFADICRSWCLFHTVPVHTFSLHALLSTDIGTVSFVSASRCNSLCLRASKGLGASASGFAVENARWKSGASCAVPISMFASTSSTSSTSSTQFALSSLYSTVYPSFLGLCQYARAANCRWCGGFQCSTLCTGSWFAVAGGHPRICAESWAVSWSFVLVVQALMMLEDMSQAGLWTIHRKSRAPSGFVASWLVLHQMKLKRSLASYGAVISACGDAFQWEVTWYNSGGSTQDAAWHSMGSVLCELLRPRNRLNYWACYRSNCLKLWKFIAWLWWLFCLRFVPTRS